MSLACEGDQEAQREATIPSFSVTSGMDYTLTGFVNGVPGNLLVDTGAAATLLAKTVWDKAKVRGPRLETPVRTRLIGVQGIPLQLHGLAQVSIKIGDEMFVTKVIVADSLTTDVILGRDFLREQQCTIEMGGSKDVLHFKGRGVAIALDSKSTENHGIDSPQEAMAIGEQAPPGVTVRTPEYPVASVLTETSTTELHQKQLDDGPIGLLLSAIEKGERPTSDVVRGQGPEAQRLAQLWDKLLVEEGVLKRRYEDSQGHSTRLQLVVPRSMRKGVLQELHAGALEGHLGEEKTLLKVKEHFYWPGMQGDVQDWCRTCATCATRKTAPTKNRAPLQTIKTGYPMQVVSVDILGPLLESDAGNSYVLVAGDHFTKWMEAYAIPNQEAITVARKLTDEMFCRFSPPE